MVFGIRLVLFLRSKVSFGTLALLICTLTRPDTVAGPLSNTSLNNYKYEFSFSFYYLPFTVMIVHIILIN